MKIMQAEKFWDRMAKNFDADERPDETIDRIAPFLKPDDAVLDVGCAAGIVTLELCGLVKSVLGIDYAQKMIDAAQHKATERQASTVRFEKTTLFELDSGEAAFDVVIALNVLHLLPDTQAVMQRVYALLKPGGLLISETVCLRENHHPIGVVISLISKIGLFPVVHNMKSSELEAAAINASFQIISSTVFYEGSIAQHFMAAKKVAP